MSSINTEMCRVCSLESNENEPMWVDPDGSELTEVGTMFAECIMPQLLRDDGYPEGICFPCNLQLIKFYNFKLAAMRMHKLFTNKIRREKITLKSELHLMTSTATAPAAEHKDSVGDCEIKAEAIDEIVILNEAIDVNDVILEEEVNSQPSEEGSFEEYEQLDECVEEAVAEDIKVEQLEESSMDVMYLDEEYVEDDLISIGPDDDGTTETDDAVLKQNYTLRRINDAIQEIDQIAADDHSVDSEFATNYMADVITTAKIKSIIRRNNKSCLKCKKTFSTEQKYKKHMSEMHEQFKCNQCGKSFQTVYRLRVHVDRHSTERPVQCDHCVKRFKNKYDLKVHMRVHENIRKYVCDICGQAFRAHTHLINHIDSHAVVNTYNCEYCNLMYKTPISLKRHIRSMHTNKDDYACPLCPKKFGLKFRYERHLQIHRNQSALANKEKARKHEFEKSAVSWSNRAIV